MSVTLQTIATVKCTHPGCPETLQVVLPSGLREEINKALAQNRWAVHPSDDVDPLPSRDDLCHQHKTARVIPSATGRRGSRR